MQQFSRNDRDPRQAPAADTTVRCEVCDHMIPQPNLAIHQATCHSSHQERCASPNNQEPPVAIIRCERCNKNIPSISKVAHDATCHLHAPSSLCQQRNPSPAVDTSTETSHNHHTTTIIDAATATNSASPVDAAIEVVEGTTENRDGEQEAASAPQEWACPRCTLLNPVNLTICEACGYNSDQSASQSSSSRIHTPGSEPNTNRSQQVLPNGTQVEIQEVDPRVGSAIGSTVSVAGWSLVGALFGGPVGALVGGGTAAILDGIQRVQSRGQPQQPSRPRVVFSSTRVSTTPWGSTMTVSTNAGGARRNVTIRSQGQINRADQQILQMLLLNALSQGAENPDQMSFEELLQRFGAGPENPDRGASQETINRIPLTKLDAEGVASLPENQDTCNICLEKFKEGDETRKLTCSHGFHKDCIDRWLSHVASCPICKKELEST